MTAANNPPLKILVLSDYRAFHETRPEAFVFLALAKRGHEVHIMTYPNNAYTDQFKAGGIHLTTQHPKRKWNRQEIQRTRAYILQHGIEIVHAFNSISTMHSVQAVRGTNAKLVLYRGYTRNIQWYNPISYLKHLNPRVDAIQCNSIGVTQALQAQLRHPEKAVTINKGHLVEWYTDVTPIDIRKTLNLPPEALLLITVANNRPFKGISYLLEAMQQLPKDRPIHLVLVGRNMDHPKNLAFLKKHQLEERVHLVGFQPQALAWTAGADCFVLPSLYGESITKSVIEAMALKVPALITSIPGNVELLEHGVSGWTVPPGDPTALAQAILAIEQQRQDLPAYGQRAQQHLRERLNHHQTVDQVEALYQRLCRP